MSLVQEVADEVFLLTVPVPVIMKDVNIYIFRGEVPALVDVGTNAPEVVRLLDEALDHLGMSNPSKVLITHWHVDHAGGASRLQQQGTEIIIGRKDLHEWQTFMQPDSFVHFQNQICEEWGVPEQESRLINRIYSGLNRFTSLPAEVKLTEDGELIRAGNMLLRVIESPGHCQGHLCFYNEQDGLLFTGDQLLPNQIAYPGAWLEDDHVVSGSVSYLKSLREMEKLEAKTYFPGHGDPQPDPASRCREVLEQVQTQSQRYIPRESVFSSAYDLSKEKPSPDRLFFNLHLVAGWKDMLKNNEQIGGDAVQVKQ
jgi:glyoxylase-like metal-dependent hydrolase (beta-lactamase superfamily II)